MRTRTVRWPDGRSIVLALVWHGWSHNATGRRWSRNATGRRVVIAMLVGLAVPAAEALVTLTAEVLAILTAVDLAILTAEVLGVRRRDDRLRRACG